MNRRVFDAALMLAVSLVATTGYAQSSAPTQRTPFDVRIRPRTTAPEPVSARTEALEAVEVTPAWKFFALPGYRHANASASASLTGVGVYRERTVVALTYIHADPEGAEGLDIFDALVGRQLYASPDGTRHPVLFEFNADYSDGPDVSGTLTAGPHAEVAFLATDDKRIALASDFNWSRTRESGESTDEWVISPSLIIETGKWGFSPTYTIDEDDDDDDDWSAEVNYAAKGALLRAGVDGIGGDTTVFAKIRIAF